MTLLARFMAFAVVNLLCLFLVENGSAFQHHQQQVSVSGLLARIQIQKEVAFHGAKKQGVRESFATRLFTSKGSDEQNVAVKRPYPRAGDIVTFPGKWQDETSFGRIRNLQYIESRNAWIADVLPLNDIGENIYSAKRAARTEVYDVKDLRPVRSFYVRSSDGYKVIFGKDGAPAFFADSYEVEGFKLPKPKVDEAAYAQSAVEYRDLKGRLLRDTALFGAACAAAAAVFQGPEDGAVFGLGVLTSCLYVVLLGKKTDAVGKKGSMDDQLGNARFFLPFLLVGGIALEHALTHDYETGSYLATVPRDQFGAAVLGFLSYRVPLLFRELGAAVDGTEIAELLPGSLGAAAKLTRAEKEKEALAAAGSAPAAAAAAAAPVLVVSGPRLLGRSRLAARLVARDPARFAAPAYLTTRPPPSSREAGEAPGGAEEFVFVSEAEFARAEDGLLEVYEEGGHRYGLSPVAVRAPAAAGKVCVLDCTPEVVRRLLAGGEDLGVDPVGVWVSLASLAMIEERVTAELERLFPGQDVAARARAETDRAVSDIEFAVKSRAFDFTVINTDEEASLEKLEDAALYALRLLRRGD